MAGKMKLFTSSLQAAAAALILLSATAESLQCYWCGPLAEQVHRSQRAPSCDNVADHMTACDPGYTHCAVVASSPPFVESRYCVKFYQDECYTLFCNSTKTYRMTCPCRGELCNGPNTQREIDAFAVLAKAVSKTQNTRIKKRNAIFSNNFIKTKVKIVHLIQNEEGEENINDTKPDMDNTESAVENEISENIQVSNFTNDNMMQSDQSNENSNPVTLKHEEINDETIMVKTTTIDDKYTENEVPDMTTPKSAEITNANPEMMDTKVSELPPVLQTTVEEVKSFISQDIKPSMELPTAEALQHDSDPLMTSEKPTEQTSTESSSMTTMENAAAGNTSPKSTKATRNSAECIIMGSWLIVFKLLIINTII